jgi:nucleotide-binding universal stress UspA family protein
MSGVILVFLSQPESTGALLDAAQRLARLCGAVRINGLAVRLPPALTILPSEEVLTREKLTNVRERERGRADLLKAGFDRWAAGLADTELQTGWFDVEAGSASAVAEYGARSDVIVLPRPSGGNLESEQQALNAALFDAERPVLVIPPDKASTTLGRRVAIAWRDDPRTVKAVLSALRLIGQPEHIDVITGVREGAGQPRLPEIFEDHAVPAELRPMPLPPKGAFGAALLDKAHALSADMLVMGAFAHNPLRNLVLGGVTRHMLAHADLPVLMRH